MDNKLKIIRAIAIGIVLIGVLFFGFKLIITWDENNDIRKQAQKNLPASYQYLIVIYENQADSIDKLLLATNVKDKEQAMLNVMTSSADALDQSLEINRLSLNAYNVEPYAIYQVTNDLHNELKIAMNEFVQTDNREKVETYQFHLRGITGALAKYKLTSKKAVSQLSGADIINYGVWLVDLEILTRENTLLNRITVSRQDEIDVLLKMVTGMEWKSGILDIRTPDFKMAVASQDRKTSVGYDGWIDESGRITIRDRNKTDQYGVIDATKANEAKKLFEKYGWGK